MHRNLHAISGLYICFTVAIIGLADANEAIGDTVYPMAAPTEPDAVVTGASSSYVNDFIVRNGSHLQFRTSGQTYKFLGVNQYALINNANLCGQNYSDSQIDQFMSQVHNMGGNAVRFWAFMSLTAAGTNFTQMDYLLQDAQKYNVRVIPVFENEWQDCTAGGQKYDSWYQSGYLTNYGGGTDYKTYVKRVVSRYKNSTAILMWQLMNEAEDSGSGIYSFASNMSSYIKSIDGNHMVNLGTMATGQAGVSINHNPCNNTDGFVKIYGTSSIDIAEAHDYGSAGTPNPSHIQDDLNCSNNVLNKPFFIGEAGIDQTDNNRPTEFKNKMQYIFSNSGDGYLVWIYNSGDQYVFTHSDPLATSTIPAISSEYSIH